MDVEKSFRVEKTELMRSFLLTDQDQDALQRLEEFNHLMMKYHAVIREVTTKLEILNDEFSHSKRRNPIETISFRIKKPISIAQKLRRKGVPVAVDSIMSTLNDVAGIRVICSFVDDIYAVAEMLIQQDDVRLIEKKDYIQNPKPNGYRSYHMIVEIPVFFSDRKKPMRVEVQIRTIAMDFWASLDHQLKYKKDVEEPERIAAQLKECADIISSMDERMQQIRDQIEMGKKEE